MLPILRIIPVGGVSLAILILVLAFTPPGGPRPPLTPAMMPARGVLITRSDHPEWRQLLINAALRRAEELSELRLLPDSPPPTAVSEPDKAPTEDAQKPSEVAGVPTNQSDAQPEDATGTIVQSPDAAIPVGVGEASSFELPVTPQDERPPVIRTPERRRPSQESLNVAPEPAKPAPQSQKRSLRHTRRARVEARTVAPLPFNLLELLFRSFTVNRQTANPGF
jgi:hypothetical protein